MITLKRISAIITAYLISTGLFVVFLIYVNFEQLRSTHYTSYLILHSIEINLIFASPVFLSCWFFPRPKKIGVLFSTAPAFILVIGTIVIVFLNKHVLGDIGLNTIVSFGSTFSGLVIGVLISFYAFENKGWIDLPTQIGLEEDY